MIFQDDFSAYIGTIDEEAFELGKIDMLEGSLPSREEEIVLDKYLLKQIAPDAKVGDTVTIPFQETRDGSRRSYEFVLSGVMNQWQENWDKANYPLPSAFVNEKNDLYQNIEEITNCFFLGKEENNYAVSHLDELLKAHEYPIHRLFIRPKTSHYSNAIFHSAYNHRHQKTNDQNTESTDHGNKRLLLKKLIYIRI